ncbi:MAG: acyl-ACP--UDP-N-acetylglucosamine O-acyltransferase [bacterium]
MSVAPHQETAPVRKIQISKGRQNIHPAAYVHPKAKLGRNVTVGPFSIVDADVELGDGTEVMNHVTINGPTVIGQGNRFFPYCSIGQDPQDKKYDGAGDSALAIGDGNTFREYVTVHRGTPFGRGITRIGHENWIMAYCHIAHDCMVGDHTIFANGATLGGHVTVGDQVLLGGFTAIHQHCKIGEVAMTGGHTMIARDIPPFVLASGNRVKLYGVNKVGLERSGYPPEEIENIKKAYRIYFRSKLPARKGLAKIEAELTHSPAVRTMVDFIKNSERGIAR